MVRVLEEYAEKNNIPIMQKDGIEFLLKYIEENSIKSILEIKLVEIWSIFSNALL